ncbi:MAG: hypothetical protein KDA84_22615, partial [Planctomycetaceae bacterium]|nr:hypothetical protein [Planctomycetaceae bacterium]
MTGKFWCGLAAISGLGAIVCFVCGGLSGQSTLIVPQPKSPGVELLSPDFGTNDDTPFKTVIVPAGQEATPNSQVPGSHASTSKMSQVIWANAHQPVAPVTRPVSQPKNQPTAPAIVPIPEHESNDVFPTSIPGHQTNALNPPPVPLPSQPVCLSPDLVPYL